MAPDNLRPDAACPDPALPPSPDPAFHWTRESWGLALRAALLEPHAQHLFTSSQLRLPANGSTADREHAWQAIAAALSVPRERLLRVRQVHGRVVRVIRRDQPATADAALLPDGDALVSNLPGSALVVVVADCVPILLVDARRGAAGAVHAGWRGTCAAIARVAVDAMRETWGTDPRDLRAALGPSIGPADYQVGESLIEEFERAGHAASIPRWFIRDASGLLRLDLWRANRDQLEAAGLPADRIVESGLSTAAYADWLESYRRDGAAAGRLVAAIVVPEARSDGR